MRAHVVCAVEMPDRLGQRLSGKARRIPGRIWPRARAWTGTARPCGSDIAGSGVVPPPRPQPSWTDEHCEEAEPKAGQDGHLLEPDPKKARLDVAKTVAKALAVPPLPKPPAQTAGVEVAGDSGSRAGNAAASAAPRGPEALAPQAEVGHAVSGLVDAASVTLPADGRVGQDDPFPDAEAKVDAQTVEQWLRVAVKKVQERLPRVLQNNRGHPGLESLKVGAPLHEQPPLQLPQTVGDGGAMSSYKAGWDKSLALPSLRTTGMYEASANITWLNPYCGDAEARIIAGDPIEWAQLCQVSDMYLSNSAD